MVSAFQESDAYAAVPLEVFVSPVTAAGGEESVAPVVVGAENGPAPIEFIAWTWTETIVEAGMEKGFDDNSLLGIKHCVLLTMAGYEPLQ